MGAIPYLIFLHLNIIIFITKNITGDLDMNINM